MQIKPLHDRIVVHRLDPEQSSSGGIVIPDTASEKPTQGRVIAVGSGKVLDKGDTYPLSVKVGDRVLFGKSAGTEVEVSGDKLLVLREEDVLGVIEA